MKAGLARRVLAASAAALISISLSLVPLARVYANSPYFKVFGGDTSSGGWFSDASKTSCISSSNFQDNNYNGDNSYGGIYTFAQSSGPGYEGASSQYAAFSLGKIDGGAAPNGFYSDATLSPLSTPSTLSFANINSLNPPGFIGGLWAGANRNSAQCIPDYYDLKKPTAATATASLSASLSGTMAYTASSGGNPSLTLLSGNTVVQPNADISVFVDGNVYIDHNISYAPHNTTNIPRFVLVVKGSIYIDPTVSNLDGLYVAQPDATNAATLNNPSVVGADTGVVWTCHNSGSLPPSGVYVTSNCTNPLTFNGAVIAKQVNLLRVGGDVGDNNANPAERFNYTPEMVLAGPFFPTNSDINGTTSPQPVFQSILSLPPIF